MRKRNPRKSAVLQMELEGAQILLDEARAAVTWLAAEVARKNRKNCCFCCYRHSHHCVKPPTDETCRLAIEANAYRDAKVILNMFRKNTEVK